MWCAVEVEVAAVGGEGQQQSGSNINGDGGSSNGGRVVEVAAMEMEVLGTVGKWRWRRQQWSQFGGVLWWD